MLSPETNSLNILEIGRCEMAWKFKKKIIMKDTIKAKEARENSKNLHDRENETIGEAGTKET